MSYNQKIKINEHEDMKASKQSNKSMPYKHTTRKHGRYQANKMKQKENNQSFIMTKQGKNRHLIGLIRATHKYRIVLKCL